MISYFQNRYALSREGAQDFVKSIILSTLLNLSFMIPVFLGILFFSEYSGSLVKSLNSDLQRGSIIYYVIFSLLFIVIMYVIAYSQYGVTYGKIYEESAKRRITLAETLRRLPLAFFAKKDVADLSATIMDDATQIEMLFSHSVPQIYASCLTIIFTFIMLFFYNWYLTLSLFWVVPVAVAVFLLSKKFQINNHIKLYNIKREISDKVQEELELAQEIKSYGQEENFSEALNTQLDDYERQMIRMELIVGSSINLSYTFLRLGLPSVLIYGGYLLIDKSITFFTYIVFIVIAAGIYNSIMEVMNNFMALIYLNVRINRMKEIDNMPKQTGSNEFVPENYNIEFKNVNFSYQKGMQTLNNISFTAKQGEVTALVGPSGGGKSTVAKLSARFWDIDSGKITLGGEDISKIDPEVLLQKYSIVFQEVTLFNSSVMENIRLGKRDASDDEVIKAAALAQCEDFIAKLPDGYGTIIGENGAKLSGGERQRISIARAILKNAPIVLLDEATASLDMENESRIQLALSELVKNKTVIIIAHRMRTVLNADKIIVIKDGVIAEKGSPAKLQEKQGIFSSMIQMQLQNALICN